MAETTTERATNAALADHVRVNESLRRIAAELSLDGKLELIQVAASIRQRERDART